MTDQEITKGLKLWAVRIQDFRIREFRQVAAEMFKNDRDSAMALSGAMRQEMDALLKSGEVEVVQHNKLTGERPAEPRN